MKGKQNRPTEQGNIIDQLGSIIVMFFVFAMILAYAAYGNVVQKRLSIDNVAKKYLYLMEQNGQLTSDDQTDMTNELANYGVTVVNYDGTTTVNTRVAYGDTVNLVCHVLFENPLYSVFETGDLIKIPGFNQNIEYTVELSATSKW